MTARKVSVESTEPKPSLASLKPDKSKGEAAKKTRAIKRMVATASKKSTPVRIKKISDSLGAVKKKTVVSTTKVRKSLEREPSKTVTIKSTVSAKRVVKQAQPKKMAEKFAAERNERIERSSFVVKLPSNMSIRAREKALVIMESVLSDFEVAAERVSLVAGLCFVMLGSYLALTMSGVIPGGQAAQVISSTTDSTLNTTALTTEQLPVFRVLDQIPPELTASAQYTFSLTNATNVSVSMYSLETGTRTSINSERLLDATYRYTIEAGKLSAGSYVVKVAGESVFTHTKYSYDLGHFRVPAPLTTEPVSTASSTPDTTISTDANVTPSTDSSTLNTNNTTNTTNSTTETSTSTPVIATTQPKLRLIANSELKDQALVKLYAPTETRFIELYARPIKSINSRYLGLAEKQSEAWYYFFNTKNVPNGDYELYGRTRLNDQFIQSNSVNTRISNTTTLEPATTIAPVSTTAPITETVSHDDEDETDRPDEPSTTETNAPEPVENIVALPVRTFSEARFEAAASSSSADPTVTTQSNSIFAEYKEQLNYLLRRYAVAIQSKDRIMLRVIEGEITQLKDTILKGVLGDPSLNTLADNVSQEFDDRLGTLKKRIETFEDLRHTAGTEDVSVDTDGDGISDYDEHNLYQTDAHAVDSDNDGFTDGIEIMRGFDPRDPAGEVEVVYELPQDTVGLEEPDVLRVEAVYPSIKETETNERMVQSEIHGKALPNSFVTLYIFSSPTIVTVRTDEAGSFVYTFEKELEDGEHEIYAAVTDNSGAVIAHSKPFKFVKEAEAFTPVDAAGIDGTNTLTLADFKQFELYKTVIGLGVLALGIILLMLGFNFRHTRRESIMTLPDDIKVA